MTFRIDYSKTREAAKVREMIAEAALRFIHAYDAEIEAHAEMIDGGSAEAWEIADAKKWAALEELAVAAGGSGDDFGGEDEAAAFAEEALAAATAAWRRSRRR